MGEVRALITLGQMFGVRKPKDHKLLFLLSKMLQYDLEKPRVVRELLTRQIRGFDPHLTPCMLEDTVKLSTTSTVSPFNGCNLNDLKSKSFLRYPRHSVGINPQAYVPGSGEGGISMKRLQISLEHSCLASRFLTPRSLLLQLSVHHVNQVSFNAASVRNVSRCHGDVTETTTACCRTSLTR